MRVVGRAFCIAGLVAATIAVCACGGGSTTTVTTTAAAVPVATNQAVANPRYVELSRCHTQIGISVRAHGLSCKEAKAVEGAFINFQLFAKSRHGPDTLVYGSRPAPGWTCSARVNSTALNVENVCWQGDRVVLFRWSG
jgi:hypothetical protein